MTTKTRDQIRIERAALDEQEAKLWESEMQALRDSVNAYAAEKGMSLDAFVREYVLVGGQPARKAPARGVAPPKYASPNDSSITWSGKGKAPAWFAAALQQGYSKADMDIDLRPVADMSNGARAHG